MLRYLLFLVPLLLVGCKTATPHAAPAEGEWRATRIDTYDWTCKLNNTAVGGHTDVADALAQCANMVLKDGVTRQLIGISYKIEATPVPPPPVEHYATVHWVAPTQNTDGSALTDLGGFQIAYGSSATTLTQTVDINSPTATSTTVEDLPTGTTYFAVRAKNTAGAVSVNSSTASKTFTE